MLFIKKEIDGKLKYVITVICWLRYFIFNKLSTGSPNSYEVGKPQPKYWNRKGAKGYLFEKILWIIFLLKIQILTGLKIKDETFYFLYFWLLFYSPLTGKYFSFYYSGSVGIINKQKGECRINNNSVEIK